MTDFEIPEVYKIKIDIAMSELLQANSDANLPFCSRQRSASKRAIVAWTKLDKYKAKLLSKFGIIISWADYWEGRK